MRIITFKDVIYMGKSLCDCLIKKEMNLEQALDILCNAIKALRTSTTLDKVRIKELGIEKDCDLQSGNMLSEILNELIKADLANAKNIVLVQKALANINTGITNTTDEKVKVDGSDTAGVLKDKLVGAQPGTVVLSPDKTQLLLIGFVPVGFCGFVSKAQLVNFDGTGKGKKGTDCYGWAISNGSNGTVNRLGGGVPRYVDAAGLNSAGNTGGADSVKLESKYIPSLQFAVTGNISDGLVTGVQASFKLEANKIADGSGGDVYLLRVGSGQSGTNEIKTLPLDLKHSHGHNLSSKFDNANQAALPLVPKHLLEIPIERITV